MRARAVVVGGGLAGLTAALRLAARGVRVTLLEDRPRLGGATSSFDRGGLVVDTGQHVFLRCYDEYRRFLRDIGAESGTSLQQRFDVPVFADGRRSRLFRGRALPAPAHLGGSLLRYHPMPVRARVRALRTALRLKALDGTDEALDHTGFGDWLRQQDESAAGVQALWNLLVVAALNTDCDGASLLLATKVFQTALLTRADAADIGVPVQPLSRLHGDAAHRALVDLGAQICLRSKVSAVRPDGDEFAVDTTDGVVRGDVVVVAVPHRKAAAVLPAGVVGDLSGLGSAPIVNVHVVFDRPVLDVPMLATVGSPLQWVFDRTAVAGHPGPGQYLAASLSAAVEAVDRPTALLRADLLPEFARVLPPARDARVLDFFVTRERHATFRQAPGTRALRPPASTTVPGLFLAGAWTDTGWPDTMEGAVRSGNSAARLAGEHLTRSVMDRSCR